MGKINIRLLTESSSCFLKRFWSVVFTAHTPHLVCLSVVVNTICLSVGAGF